MHTWSWFLQAVFRVWSLGSAPALGSFPGDSPPVPREGAIESAGKPSAQKTGSPAFLLAAKQEFDLGFSWQRLPAPPSKQVTSQKPMDCTLGWQTRFSVLRFFRSRAQPKGQVDGDFILFSVRHRGQLGGLLSLLQHWDLALQLALLWTLALKCTP